MRQLGVELQTQNVFDLTHIDPWCGHAVSGQKLEAYPFGCYMRNIITVCVRHRSGIVTSHSGIVTADSGIVTADSGQRRKSVTMDRNGRSRWTGMTGHDGPESAGHDGPEYPHNFHRKGDVPTFGSMGA